MSKVDALRALREAKYAADRAAAPAGTVRKAAAARPSGVTASKSGTAAESRTATRPARGSKGAVSGPSETDEAETEALCGHRNMGGKSCTRPENHSEKNHRYS